MRAASARWLINRAASKLAPRQLRGYFLGNPWDIYARRVADYRPPQVRFGSAVPPELLRREGITEIGHDLRAPARAVWRDSSRSGERQRVIGRSDLWSEAVISFTAGTRGLKSLPTCGGISRIVAITRGYAAEGNETVKLRGDGGKGRRASRASSQVQS